MKQWLPLVCIIIGSASIETNEEEAKKFIEDVYKKIEELGNAANLKQWEYDSAEKSLKDQKMKELVRIKLEEANKKFDDYGDSVSKKVNSYEWKKFKDSNTRRMFLYVAPQGESTLSTEKQNRSSKIKDSITNINATAAVRDCESTDPTLKMKYKDVKERVTRDNSNVGELKCFWKEWHDALGAPSKPLFTELMTLENEAARLSGFSNIAKYWQDQYGIDDFENTMSEWYKTVKPLYEQLHAYVRSRLKKKYGQGNSLGDPDGLIPSVLLGFMGDQGPLNKLVTPFPDKPSVHNISGALQAKKFSSTKMAKTAESYFTSLGFSKLPQDFWENSIFEEKKDVDCSSYNSYVIKKCKYRAIFCAKPTTHDFLHMHYLIGSLEYARAYCEQPYFFQQAPNVIDLVFSKFVMDLVKSPTYLKSLGLLNENAIFDHEIEINILLREAMEHLFWLPFHYAYDLWRWKVAEGKITPKHYNCEFWKIWPNLQGVKPPVLRSEDNLDVAINPDFLTGEQYIPYYIQIFSNYFIIRSLCESAGYYDPKYKPNNKLIHCDISNSKEAGKKLKEMMELGDTQPLAVALEKLTGKTKIDPSAVLDYFKPLFEWLKDENTKAKNKVGWNSNQYGCQ